MESSGFKIFQISRQDQINDPTHFFAVGLSELRIASENYCVTRRVNCVHDVDWCVDGSKSSGE